MSKNEFYYMDWYANHATWIRGWLENMQDKPSHLEKIKYYQKALDARPGALDYLKRGLEASEFLGCKKEDVSKLIKVFQENLESVLMLTQKIKEEHERIMAKN